MDPQRYNRIHEVFDRAKDLSGAELERLLERECGGDPELRREVERLLDHDRTRATLAQAFAPGPDLEPGQVIGRYKLLELLGEGGFGAVYMAEQQEPVQRRVALKVIKLGMDTRQVIARFEAERQALAMMDHPNIARIFDAGATETGRPYFVMELVRGTSVTRYCDGERLPLRARLELVVQICDALQHAHQKGVIHRDIKPSNVLVSTAGDRPVSKIIDFGIAKATSARLTERTLFTDFRQMIGTPEYMSPEQAGDSPNEADTRTDVYSTGVLLYELLTGTTPFDSKRLRSAAFGELQRIIREVDPPKPSTRVSQDTASLRDVAALRLAEPRKLGTMMRGELDWIVMKALEKDPARRYDSAGSMARDIQSYLDGEVIEAAPPSAAYRARKFARRHRGPVLAALLLAIAVLAGLIGTSVGLVEAERKRVEAELQRDRANAQRERADREAEQARTAQSVADRRAYTATLLSAGDALAVHRDEQARFFLDAAPEELRGWEWRVFESRLDTSTRVLDAPVSRPDARPGANALLAHPDGRSCFVVRGFESPAARWIDLESGAILAEYDHPAGAERSSSTEAEFFLSPDGARLHALSGSADTGALWVSTWDLGSGQRLRRGSVDPGRGLPGRPAISPDGARLALSHGEEVWLQDADDGATLVSGNAGLGVVRRRFSPDGALLAVADGFGGLALLDGRTLEPRATLEGHRNLITALDFSPDGRWLGSSAIDDTARVWDLRSSPPSAVVLEHPQAVASIRLSPSGARAATACGDRALRVWDVETGELVGVATAADLLVDALMFLPDERTIAGRQSDGTLRFWDVEAESTVNLRGHRGLVNGAAFAEGAGLIVSVGWDGWTGNAGCVRFWDAETGVEVASWGRPGEIARHLAVSPDGRRAATTVSPRRYQGMPEDAERMDGVLIVDLSTGETTALEAYAASLAFDPTSELLALAWSERLEVRGARDGGLLRGRTSGFEGMDVDDLAWSPDGRLLACSLTTRGVDPAEGAREHLLLDLETLDTVHRLDAGPISFSPDGERLFAGAVEGAVQVLRVGTWELLETIAEHGLSAPVFSADGARLATRLGGEGEILVWDALTYDRVASLRRPGFVSTVAWSADAARLVGACGRTVCVWDDVPLADRAQEREARRSASEIIAPLTDRLFEELAEPARVLERLEADPSLSALQLRVARHEVLRRGLASPLRTAPGRPGAGEER